MHGGSGLEVSNKGGHKGQNQLSISAKFLPDLKGFFKCGNIYNDTESSVLAFPSLCFSQSVVDHQDLHIYFLSFKGMFTNIQLSPVIGEAHVAVGEKGASVSRCLKSLDFRARESV